MQNTGAIQHFWRRPEVKVKRGWGSNIGKGSGGSDARRKTGILRLRHEVSHFFLINKTCKTKMPKQNFVYY